MLTWVLDRRGAIIFRSPEWAAYTGIAEPDLRFRLRSQAVHPDDFARVEHDVDDAVTARRPFLVTYRLKRADETYGWVATGGSPSFSVVDGAFVGYLGTTTPTTAAANARPDGPRHRAVLVLDGIASQIMAVRTLAKHNAQAAIVKVLDLALLLTGNLLTQAARRL